MDRCNLFHHWDTRSRNEIKLRSTLINDGSHSRKSETNFVTNLDHEAIGCSFYILLRMGYDRSMNINCLYEPLIVEIFHGLKSIRIESLRNIDIILVLNLILPSHTHTEFVRTRSFIALQDRATALVLSDIWNCGVICSLSGFVNGAALCILTTAVFISVTAVSTCQGRTKVNGYLPHWPSGFCIEQIWLSLNTLFSPTDSRIRFRIMMAKLVLTIPERMTDTFYSRHG